MSQYYNIAQALFAHSCTWIYRQPVFILLYHTYVMANICVCVTFTISLLLPHYAVGFRPTVSGDDNKLLDHNTQTHADITRHGLIQATHMYLIEKGLVNASFDAIGDFFTSGKL